MATVGAIATKDVERAASATQPSATAAGIAHGRARFCCVWASTTSRRHGERLAHDDSRVERTVVRRDELDRQEMKSGSQTRRVVVQTSKERLDLAVDAHVDVPCVRCDVR